MDGQSPEFPRPQERKERGPQNSNNQRVESVYRHHPEMANREYTLPCVTRPIYQDQSVLDNPALAQTIADHTRVIVTPSTYEKLSGDQRERVKVLASPYENGRVLEADERVRIDDEDLVLSVKGVGCTSFARTTGAENPWMVNYEKVFNEDEARKLSVFPFLSDLGGLSLEDAIKAIDQVKELEKKGLDTESILAVHEILEMSDENGVMRPISYFQDRDIFPKDERLAITFRSSKSNYRLLEPILMEKLGKNEGMSDYWNHILDEYKHVEGITQPSVKEYMYWLTEKVISQNLPLILQGYPQSPGHWQDLARNITSLGERMDMAAVKVDKGAFSDPSEYSYFVRNEFRSIDTTLKALSDTAYTHLDGNFDFMEYGDHIEAVIDHALEGVDYKALHENFNERYKESESVDNSIWLARKSVYGHYAGGRHAVGRHRDLLRKYEDYMSKKFKTKSESSFNKLTDF